ncbi:MAG: sigma 54-interacting transcriptional regulator [Myxococcales bacterium]|nr:sigma 54-interacting transcriptional regulator [Myxococcales bacterium]
MKAASLDLREVLEFQPNGGILRFAGERAVILDAVAMGLLRKQLIETIGLSGARSVLTRFGYAHGWRTAEAMKDAFPWDNEREWKIAGGRLHRLQGLVLFEPIATLPDDPNRFAEAVWHESYEAEQHLLHVGKADSPVCWTLTGFASGYLSYCNQTAIYCIEERCVAQGHATCLMIGRKRENWGEIAHEVASYYEQDCLNASLQSVATQLKQIEQKLRGTIPVKTSVDDPAARHGIVANSAPLRRVVMQAARVAQVDSTVLVTGESGVGKEVIAKLIHAESGRTTGPFVAVNCGAVPENLLESELFGHVRGSFTGATRDRIGLFEAANRGTLFLDEVGELPGHLQVKLLRTLQEREVRRVGENRVRPIDVRVVAATNRDLAAEVEEGRFRQDLYYRLRVVELTVPPLRERRDDILPLSRLFLATSSAKLKSQAKSFSVDAIRILHAYDWPGNVRELENVIEHAAIFATNTQVVPDDFPDSVRHGIAPTIAPITPRALEDVERDHILGVLRLNGGNRTKTADVLQIGIATLFRKLKTYSEMGFPVD